MMERFSKGTCFRHRHAIEQVPVDGVEVDAAIQDERAVFFR